MAAAVRDSLGFTAGAYAGVTSDKEEWFIAARMLAFGGPRSWGMRSARS